MTDVPSRFGTQTAALYCVVQMSLAMEKGWVAELQVGAPFRFQRLWFARGCGNSPATTQSSVASDLRSGIASELEALVALHQKGALTDGEFAAAKAKLLG